MISSDVYNENVYLLGKDEKKISYALTLIAITSTLAINHSDSTIPERQFVWVSHSIMALSMLYLIYKTLTRPLKMEFWGLLLVFVFWWFVSTFYVFKSSDVNLNLSTIITLCLFCCFNKRIWCFSYDLYYKYIVIMAFFGIIAYLHTSLSLNILPKTICPYYAQRLTDNYLYYDYYVSYVLVEFPFIRLCGLFNEPGYFGTFLGLFLVAEKFNLKRKNNIILLIAGIFTFSAAFFITIILYYAFILIQKRNFKILFIVLLVIVIVPNLNIQNENYIHLMERFTFADGKLNAVNRTGDAFDRFYDDFIFSPQALLGYGRGYLAYKQEIGNLSYKTYIVEYGLLACFAFWGGLFYNAVKMSRHNKEAILFAALFMINIYQRPGIYIFGYMLLLYGGIAKILIQNEYSKNISCTKTI